MSLIINLLVLNTIVKQVDQYDSDGKIRTYIFGIAFPLLVALAIALTPGIYLITSVTDRELRLRYLLNFIGMRSTSYFAGIVLADLTIFFIPTLLVTSIIFILNLDMLKG